MNKTELPIEQIKLDYIDIFEKNIIKNNKKIIGDKDILNNYESKRATKSNTNHDSHNNK